MIVLILLVVWLGARGAAADAIWYDEWWTMNQIGITPLAGNPDAQPFTIAESLERLSRAQLEPNPPAYYLAINLWSRITGNSGFAMRALSLLGATLALACVYRAGVALHSREAGLYAALLIGTSAFFITYAHEARVYMLLMMFSALTILSYWRAVNTARPLTPMVALLLVLGVAGMVYSHYMALPILVALGINHLFTFRMVRRWWLVAALVMLGGLTIAPWLPVTLAATNFINTDSRWDFFARPPLELLQRLLARFSNESIGLLLVMAWLALPTRRFVWVLAVPGFLVALILNESFGFITDVHYLLAFFPVLALLAGVGMARLPKVRVVFTVVWAVSGVWLTLFPPRNLDPRAIHPYLPWHEARAILQAQAEAGDTVLFALPAPDPNWIHQPVGDHLLYDLNLNLRVLESLPEATDDVTRQQLTAFTDRASRLWLLSDPQQPPSLQTEREVRAFFDVQFLPCPNATHDSQLNMALYIPRFAGALRGWRIGGDDISLEQMNQTLLDASGAQITLRTTLAPDLPRSTYSLALHVENADGQLVAQADGGLPDADLACQVLHAQTSLPAGNYTLYLVVYAWETGERLLMPDGADRLRVETVRLE
jgi:hypothetical protein